MLAQEVYRSALGLLLRHWVSRNSFRKPAPSQRLRMPNTHPSNSHNPPKPSASSTDTNNHSDSNSPPAFLPNFILPSPHNHCYINSCVYCLAVAEKTLQQSWLPTAFHARIGEAVQAGKALGFHILGWRRPDAQHDVAEFVDHLTPRLISEQLVYRRSAKISDQGELVRKDGGHLGAAAHPGLV